MRDNPKSEQESLELWVQYGNSAGLPFWVIVIDAAGEHWGSPWKLIDEPGSLYWLIRKAAWADAKQRRNKT